MLGYKSANVVVAKRGKMKETRAQIAGQLEEVDVEEVQPLERARSDPRPVSMSVTSSPERVSPPTTIEAMLSQPSPTFPVLVASSTSSHERFPDL